ncbi:MAG: hypothetical protein KF819_35060 [Labilithrix sp.]|nr:hypothetical protein [Labilithrix sp.]
MRRALTFALVAAVSLAARASSAQTTDAAKAEQLFEEGTKLFDAGRFAEACDKLEASQRLDPALGTQFNLAECWQRVGRLASARALFREVAKIAHATGRAEVEQRARDRLAKLDVETPMLTVVVTGTSRPDAITVDGTQVTEQDLAKGHYVDPGDHVVEATARGKQPFRNTLSLTAGARSTVSIPDLAPDPSAASTVTTPREDAGGTQRTLAMVAFGVGGAGVLLGSVFGIVSMGSNSDAKALCPDPKQCSERAGFEAWNDARSAGNVSTAMFVIGGVAAAAGAALWITAPKSSASVGLTPGGAVARLTW